MNKKTFNIKEKNIPTTAEIIEQTKNQFENAGVELSPIKIRSENQAFQEIEYLASKIDEKNEWDVQIKAIKRGMSLINGNALKFESFYINLFKISDGLIKGALNLRSQLVKLSCLFLSQLAKSLGSKFDIMGDVITPLSKQTSHGTLIIAESCKLTILQIAKNCQKKSILNSIIELSNSKSNNIRQISIESLILIFQNWDKSLLLKNIEIFSKVLIELLSDSNQDVRNYTKIGCALFIYLFSKKASPFLSLIDSKTKKSIQDINISEYLNNKNENNRRHSSSPEKNVDSLINNKPRRSSVSKIEKIINNEEIPNKSNSMKNNNWKTQIPINIERKNQNILENEIKQKFKSKIPKILNENKNILNEESNIPKFSKIKRNKSVEIDYKNTSIPRVSFSSKDTIINNLENENNNKRHSTPNIIKNYQIYHLENGNELSFLTSIINLINNNDKIEIKKLLKKIIPGLIVCSMKPEIDISLKSLQLINNLIRNYPKDF